MNELNLYNSLVEAWETSTMKDNRFLRKIESVDWDYRFFADGEYYFIVEDFSLTTPTLDPFGEHKWSPCVVTSDHSILWINKYYAALVS